MRGREIKGKWKRKMEKGKRKGKSKGKGKWKMERVPEWNMKRKQKELEK